MRTRGLHLATPVGGPGDGLTEGGRRVARTSPLAPADFGKPPMETSATPATATRRPQPAEQLEPEVPRAHPALGSGRDGERRLKPGAQRLNAGSSCRRPEQDRRQPREGSLGSPLRQLFLTAAPRRKGMGVPCHRRSRREPVGGLCSPCKGQLSPQA